MELRTPTAETQAIWETMRAAARAYARDPSQSNAARLSEAVQALKRLEQRRQARRLWQGAQTALDRAQRAAPVY